ncbi:TrmH family RNA methyltransferase [Ignicoccus hospitalis]|uniref:tRNA/rRNA methyltransferase (SpoU) n=1 Tax=Ignicoccus hospitalis (strain KIN4/I / DSM 18386 / JCM 14125) TaxID=453591 RepID=A8A8Q9_IGNH4|nr:TrmH family RNA methyltransferase [Ignicoccus hospitalis]ABU81311.1 tRNA/rRNA methyltransferase (SpoU) [Ignicoccus hospitalis KIN4/I]HIH90385.1 rRNA methyltransferase [Desulfurococcaceae archaeon]
MKVRLVLVEPEGKINFGFILRLCKNFEVDEIVAVRPKFDVRDEEVLTFAANGRDYVDKVKVVDDYKEALEGLVVCTSAKVSSADPLRDFVLPWELKEKFGEPERLTLVFGRESVGLTREELKECDALLHVPASPQYPVMNLSHAVAVVLWEVWKQYRIEKGAQPERPDERDLRLALGVAERLARALIKDEAKRERVTVAIKRLLAKATRQELRNLLYLLSKCANRLGE